MLLDGKVTVCEELYHHKHLIIGDLTEQTLQEVGIHQGLWNLRARSRLQFPTGLATIAPISGSVMIFEEDVLGKLLKLMAMISTMPPIPAVPGRLSVVVWPNAAGFSLYWRPGGFLFVHNKP